MPVFRFLFLVAGVGAFSAVQDVHADNFDDVISSNGNVLVHFWAPCECPLGSRPSGRSQSELTLACACPGSKKCTPFKMELERMAASDEWEGVIHARSDISDNRGYTSYLETHGVLKLPTLVLFRNGHPERYPHEEPLTEAGVKNWLAQQLQGALA